MNPYKACAPVSMTTSASPRSTVVAAVIEREGSVLICQRRRDDSHPFKWEFPGGKVEAGRVHARRPLLNGN